ncbi:MnuA family membrane nuclease [Metamycoplasma neophronis]|uniref:Endonuclease/exonuclease/phosphatase domain-containing protein n=1 Tax=Metamycoplasma neophronis TaxID=872983 RepID=A0ABY2Z1K9_9BACT|nr:endonuclease/exonuclease/phosphatase family protein [Metamycoplasma neophronis]TPR54703.1 hypothetical protein FJR74_00320 [Metamycoplasma neophronis]
MANKKTTKKSKGGLKAVLSIAGMAAVGAIAYGAYYLVNKIKSDKSGAPIIVNKSIDKNSDIKLMSWNVFNFGKSTPAESNKFVNIVKTIKLTNADVIGLEEIGFNDITIINKLIKKLNDGGSNKWSYTLSDAFNQKYPNSKESVAILYKNDILRLDSTNVINPNNIYTRPLYFAKFTYLAKPYTFVTGFGHFDAPGVNTKNNEKDSIGSQGSQEVLENKSIDLVFKELKKLYPNTDILMAADTNLKENHMNIYDQKEYKLGYPENYAQHIKDYRTSLGAKPKKPSDPLYYANTYDKWFVYDAEATNIDYLNASKHAFSFDTLQAFKNGYWDREESKNLYMKLNKNKPQPSDYDLVKNVSDHIPVFININI